MSLLDKELKSSLTLMLLVLFLLVWSWTEITEYQNRTDFVQGVTEFVSKGDRFTKQDADLLEARVLVLEKEKESE